MDRRKHLKIKIKTLAAEARIIRCEERKLRGSDNELERSDLCEHRRGIVRRVARENHLAYGFIRGRAYRRLEFQCRTEPNWNAVWTLVKRFGDFKETDRAAFDAWREGRAEFSPSQAA